VVMVSTMEARAASDPRCRGLATSAGGKRSDVTLPVRTVLKRAQAASVLVLDANSVDNQ
jgi:hypothetical protein